MNEYELRILGDHLFRCRRIFFDQNISIESTLENVDLSNEEKMEDVKNLLLATKSKLNSQQVSYNKSIADYNN